MVICASAMRDVHLGEESRAIGQREVLGQGDQPDVAVGLGIGILGIEKTDFRLFRRAQRPIQCAVGFHFVEILCPVPARQVGRSVGAKSQAIANGLKTASQGLSGVGAPPGVA